MSATDSKDSPPTSSLSQLWSGFGSTTSELNIGLSANNIFGSGSNGSNSVNNSCNNSSNLGFSNLANDPTPNEGYVNFNQFIEQHNLIATNGVGMNNACIERNYCRAFDVTNTTAYDIHTQSHNVDDALVCLKQKINNNDHGVNNTEGDSFYRQPNYYFATASDRGCINNNNISNPYDISFNRNSTLDSLFSGGINPCDALNKIQGLDTVQYGGACDSGGSFSKINNIYKRSTQIYENLYTPFSNNGTTYYANPFATGFDFKTSTILQPTAAEFIPRLDQLSITGNNNLLQEMTENTIKLKEKGEQTKEGNNENALKFKIKHKKEGNSEKTSYNIDEKRQNDQFLSIYNDNHTKAIQRNKINNNNNYNNKSCVHSNSHQKLLNQQKKSYNRLEKNIERFSRNFLNNNKFNDSTSNSNSLSPSAGGGEAENLSSITKESTLEFNQTQNREDEKDNQYHSNYNNINKTRKIQSGGYNNGGNGSINSINNMLEFSREERFDRYSERSEVRDRNSFNGGASRYNRERDYHLRFDNYRSNKRRDDWNRNRGRIIGYHVEEKFSNDSNRETPLHSPEKKTLNNGGSSGGFSPKKLYADNEKLSQREKLTRDIEMRRLECLVCVEPIKSHHGVWSCYNCYHILHLQCIIKWASSSKSDDGWRCPACQNVVKDVPHDYNCFCGKVKNPPNSRQDLAHSCGEVCGRVEGCQHACTLLCHPGPCPPCQANVKRTCGCGKTIKTMQCCLKETINCDAICSKLLICEVHRCDVKCHLGKCPPCREKVKQKCHCTKQERQVACTRDSHGKHVYSCGKPCGKNLSCGNHKCKDCCHAGECRPCKLSPDVISSCPCGKLALTPRQRTSCLDPIPVCDGVCGKTLRCGKPSHPHHCTSKCHLGQCPPCNKQTAVKCRCGHMDQMIKCRQLSTRADEARCKKRCVKKRSCGKHKCNQECCIDFDHICPLPCNYTLSCGKHKCDQPCHRGNCPPCYRSSFEELFCECGAEVIYPPVPCGTKRPLCNRPCLRKHQCNHPPQHNCHSATNCPPCMIFTTKWCYGQHEQRKTIPCSQQSFSCGMACNKPLICKRHKCIKTCHDGICQNPGEICKQNCPILRNSCGHKCMAPCHEGNCPETQCKEMVEVQCECGHRKLMRPCHELAREYSRIATAQLASSMAEMQRGNYMELSEILAPVKLSNKTNKTLDCNDECRILERNRRLQISLKVRNADLSQKIMTKYSDFIRNFAKRDPVLVKSVHEALTTLVKLAKESKQKSRSHSFPIMNREKRQLVHEMCEMFGVESVAYDAEPNRNVVATAYKDRCWLPATSIMDVLQRESGQRRVPVPSNNAWGSKR